MRDLGEDVSVSTSRDVINEDCVARVLDMVESGRGSWMLGPTGVAYVECFVLFQNRRLVSGLIDSRRPDSHISGHSWEELARSCPREFADAMAVFHAVVTSPIMCHWSPVPILASSSHSTYYPLSVVHASAKREKSDPA